MAPEPKPTFGHGDHPGWQPGHPVTVDGYRVACIEG